MASSIDLLFSDRQTGVDHRSWDVGGNDALEKPLEPSLEQVLVMGPQSFRQESLLFLGTGAMVDFLKHVGTRD